MAPSVRVQHHHLTTWDAASIIVGIVVGTAIFKVPAMVFQNAGGPWTSMALWLVGGLLSLCGALCFAELASTYPRDGGEYEYLTRAFGRWMGLLFGWAQLAVVLSGNIASMAYAFADYAIQLFRFRGTPSAGAWLAAGAVVGLTVLNLGGLRQGKIAQNVLTVCKIVGLGAIVLAGLAVGFVSETPGGAGPSPPMGTNLGLALVFVLYAYGGWNHAAYVAAQVDDTRRNLPRALLYGVAGITLIYLAVNGAYLAALGYATASYDTTPAAAVLGRAIGPWGERMISLLVMISALGAINGMILTGARLFATVGQDHRPVRWLAYAKRSGEPDAPHSRTADQTRYQTPALALMVQAGIALAMIGMLGTPAGHGLLDGLRLSLGLSPLEWDDYLGPFEMLVAASAPVFWGFFLLSGIAVVVLRWHNPNRRRPFSVPGYPIPVILFLGTSAYLLYSSVVYAGGLVWVGLAPLLTGAALYGVIWWARGGAARRP